jgi:hypothetical protein
MLKTFELNLQLEQNKSVLCRLVYAVNTVTYFVTVATNGHKLIVIDAPYLT